MAAAPAWRLRDIHREPARDAILSAVVLRAGRGAVLSHDTAAELHRLVDWPSSPVHVTIPGYRRVAPISGVTVHVGARADQAAHPTQLPPRTRVEETILDLASCAVLAGLAGLAEPTEPTEPTELAERRER